MPAGLWVVTLQITEHDGVSLMMHVKLTTTKQRIPVPANTRHLLQSTDTVKTCHVKLARQDVRSKVRTSRHRVTFLPYTSRRYQAHTKTSSLSDQSSHHFDQVWNNVDCFQKLHDQRWEYKPQLHGDFSCYHNVRFAGSEPTTRGTYRVITEWEPQLR